MFFLNHQRQGALTLASQAVQRIRHSGRQRRHTWLAHADLLIEAGAETVIKRLADLPKVAEAVMSWDGLVG